MFRPEQDIFGWNKNDVERPRLKQRRNYLIPRQGYTMGKLLDDTDCQFLLDKGVSKS